MGRLERAAQRHSNSAAWAHSTDADPSGPQWPSAAASVLDALTRDAARWVAHRQGRKDGGGSPVYVSGRRQ
jgi:hypothetical protein